MTRIKMTIEYDGTNYHGFQRQANAHTLQAEIERRLFELTGEKISIMASGRTDSGVHAKGQVIAFDSQSRIPSDRWSMALNSFLPQDIRVLDAKEVEPDFHPQFQAKRKRYQYLIQRSRENTVFYRNYAYCYPYPLDLKKMQQACTYIEGYHDFTAFCARNATSKTFDRTVYSCKLAEDGPFLCLDIEGNGFLYNMVRIITGTLIHVGLGKIEAADLAEIIKSKKRSLAGPTVPPQGLYLLSVIYE